MKITESREVLRTKIFTVTEDRAVDESGFEIHRAIVRHGGSAVMMAVDDAGRILLVRQFRLPAEDFLWELPAGRLDPGETPLDAAIRELKEETGYSAETWTEIAAYYPTPGYVSERMTIFLATGLTPGEQHTMDDERIETRWFRADELEAMVRSGTLADGKTLTGFLTWDKYHRGKS